MLRAFTNNGFNRVEIDEKREDAKASRGLTRRPFICRRLRRSIWRHAIMMKAKARRAEGLPRVVSNTIKPHSKWLRAASAANRPCLRRARLLQSFEPSGWPHLLSEEPRNSISGPPRDIAIVVSVEARTFRPHRGRNFFGAALQKIGLAMVPARAARSTTGRRAHFSKFLETKSDPPRAMRAGGRGRSTSRWALKKACAVYVTQET